MLPRASRLSRLQCGPVLRYGRVGDGIHLRLKRLVVGNSPLKVAVVVPKSVFKRSVDRHAVKRRISAALYPLVKTLRGVHVMVTAKQGAMDASIESLRHEIQHLIKG